MTLIPLCIYKQHKECLRYLYLPHVYGWEGTPSNRFLTLKSFKNSNTMYPYEVMTKNELLRNIDGIQYFK